LPVGVLTASSLPLQVEKFPSLILISAAGRVYEDTAPRRSLPTLRHFAIGGYRSSLSHMETPATLQANVPVWWLVLRSLWQPLRMVRCTTPTAGVAASPQAV